MDDSRSKKQMVTQMFDSIALTYDFLNHLLSFGTDRYWRRKAISFLMERKPETILDVATGTGDFAIEAARQVPHCKITGIDIAENMLILGRKKIENLHLQNAITLRAGDSENLPFSEETFEAVTVAFGVRNFENIDKGISEIFRVLKKKGILIILEFSHPSSLPVKALFLLYFRFILPLAGRLVSKNPTAYSYLSASVQKFPDRKIFMHMLEEAGFKETRCLPINPGIAVVYRAIK